MDRETSELNQPRKNQFLVHLASLAMENASATTPPPAKKTRGQTTRRSAPKLTAEEFRAKEAAVHRMLADSLKEKPRDKRG